MIVLLYHLAVDVSLVHLVFFKRLCAVLEDFQSACGKAFPYCVDSCLYCIICAPYIQRTLTVFNYELFTINL